VLLPCLLVRSARGVCGCLSLISSAPWHIAAHVCIQARLCRIVGARVFVVHRGVPSHSSDRVLVGQHDLQTDLFLLANAFLSHG
jgi:hypothetical protein